jgi:hypothetical protein
MRSFPAFAVTGVLCCVSVFSTSCHKEETPPQPLAVEQAPATLESAFKPKDDGPKIDPRVQSMVDDAVIALTAKNYAKAIFILQSLSGRSDLTADQRDFVTRSMLSANKALEEQANSGNVAAQEAIELRRRTK